MLIGKTDRKTYVKINGAKTMKSQKLRLSGKRGSDNQPQFMDTSPRDVYAWMLFLMEKDSLK